MRPGLRSSFPILAAPLLVVGSVPAAADTQPLPRSATPEERLYEASNPPRIPRGPANAPSGSVHCPGEYAPMQGIVFSYHSQYSTAVLDIVETMVREVTTTGQARAYVAFTTSASQTSGMTQIQAAGADMSRVVPMIYGHNSIWMRDYGPRYIYENGGPRGEGGVRAIIDHTYNRASRTLDNTFPIYFANLRRHARYDIPLIHGGGNHHLDSLGRSWATRLIANENPALGATIAQREAAVIALWQQFQNLQTVITDPFPVSIDATQHIDMWAQVIADDKVMVSQWPVVPIGNAAYEPYRVTEAFAAAVAAPAGPYEVFRVPARSVGGVHYTYTNVVMCNDLVLIPSYTNTTVAPLNAEALAAWQAALPGKTIVPVNCQAIVSLAGVMHCIVMHLPSHQGADGGLAPTAYLRAPSGPGLSYAPGQQMDIRWITDDDVAVVNVDLQLSFDSGTTWPVTIAAATADDGQQPWIVPNYFSRTARVRVVARDGGAPVRTGLDLSDADFTLAGTCRADVNNSLSLTVQDIFDYLDLYFMSDARADFNDSGAVSLQDLFDFLAAYFAGCA